MLPIVGALGVDATFTMEGRLPMRPLSPLWEEMQRMGCSLSRPTENTIRCQGRLRSGAYCIDGGVSSQFITGLLFAHALMDNCTLEITGKLESQSYIELTKSALSLFAHHHSPGYVTVEGDWSNGAFWLAANALGCDLSVLGLNQDSLQGDRAVVDILKQLENSSPTISVADIPDLVPILSVVAAAKHGAVFTDIRRLRLKESDRVASVIAMLESLGGKASATEDTLTILPGKLHGGTVDSCNDHRIAMSAAIAAVVCSAPITILGAEAVNKSYPHFWAEYRRLGGKYE
jgi:3-phosphoshikimate 1-carboxyvinyltransferase